MRIRESANQRPPPLNLNPGPRRAVELAELSNRPTHRLHPYRFVVIHHPQSEEPTAQLTRFRRGTYHYHVLVTNLPLRPLSLRRFYNDRAGSG